MLKEALYMQMRTKYTEDPKEVAAFEKGINERLHGVQRPKPSHAKSQVIRDIISKKKDVGTVSPVKGKSHHSGKTYRHD